MIMTAKSPRGCWISYIFPCWARIRHFQICWIQGACENWLKRFAQNFLRYLTSFSGIKEECIKRGLVKAWMSGSADWLVHKSTKSVLHQHTWSMGPRTFNPDWLDYKFDFTKWVVRPSDQQLIHASACVHRDMKHAGSLEGKKDA